LKMYISYPSRFETYGAVKIYELSKVYSLFAIKAEWKPGLYNIPNFNELEKTAEKTVIVVPSRNEDPMVLEGVLKAIPVYSPIILVSASTQAPLNMYSVETDIAKTLYKVTGRPTIIVHQRDPVIAEELGPHIPGILDEDGLVRYGKGEGLLISVLLADGLNAENIGFIDADNYIPGAVLEYTLKYYTILNMSESDYRMVRLSWGYKAWSSTDLYFRRMGRASTIVNNVLNKILSLRRRAETDIVKTSNSGEHAMSVKLAKEISFAGGYAVETQELVSLLEACYIGVEDGMCPALPGNIEIYQVETRNPHIHSEKGESHVIEMIIESLSTIYHSKLVDSKGKALVIDTLMDLAYEGEPPPPLKYSIPSLNGKDFLDKVLGESKTSVAYGV